MLFDEYKYFDYKFPAPQYLGAKFTHLQWILKFIPKNIKTALDAFSGSQSVSFLFKQLGLKVVTNDLLNFNHQIGLALIENMHQKLNVEDTKVLFQISNNENYQLIQSTFSDLFFEESEAKFLDNFRSNIHLLDSDYKKALAFAIMNRSMTRKVTMGHFGHTKALKYANEPERIKRNRSLVRPIKDIFNEILPLYNNAVFDNNQNNKSYNENILELLPNLENIDLAYFDPPYCDSHADYQSFYHVLETYTEYWKDKEFINGTKRYDPQRFSGFDKKGYVLNSFEELFTLSQNIPYWLISYNDRSFPSVSQISGLISKYRDVTIESKKYNAGRGGKGSVAGSNEILFICKPKKKFTLKKTYEEVQYE